MYQEYTLRAFVNLDQENIGTQYYNIFDLDLSGRDLEPFEIPDDIDKLINLQHLALNDQNYSNLPNSLFKLKYLQSLELQRCH